jgi:enterochelin esterase family protein
MIEQHVIESACGEYTRNVWFLQGPAGRTHRLAVFLDAEHYLRDMNALPVLQELIDSGMIPPIACVFVSHVSAADRHRDLTCNPRYSRFIAEDVVAWARRNNSHIELSGNVICGVSLSGLAAAYTALLHPGVFAHALCQSGSFWWFADHEADLPATNARFWLSVGSRETATDVSHPPSGLFQRISQIDGVEAARRRLEALGAHIHYRVFEGGHTFASWREELKPALTWLLAA